MRRVDDFGLELCRFSLKVHLVLIESWIIRLRSLQISVLIRDEYLASPLNSRA